MQSLRRPLALLLLALPCFAGADAFDDLVRAELEKQKVVGCAVAVIRDGQPVKVACFGLANIELDVPVTPESVFKIASISKQFVAAGAMLLVQEGKLSLEDSLAGHFSDSPDEWRGITLRHLLTHTSGLQRELPDWSGLRVYGDDDLLDMAKKAKFGFKPGEKYEYCNTGYFLVGLIVSKVSGKPWPDFLAERFFEPLGMSSTRTTSVRDIVPNRVQGYERTGESYRNPVPLLGVRTSGALLSNLLDLVKWEQALREGAILTKESLDLMWTPVALNDGATHPYGFGFMLNPLEGRRVVEHSGSLGGFRSHYIRLIESGVSVIVLANTSTANPGQLARRLALAEASRSERP